MDYELHVTCPECGAEAYTGVSSTPGSSISFSGSSCRCPNGHTVTYSTPDTHFRQPAPKEGP